MMILIPYDLSNSAQKPSNAPPDNSPRNPNKDIYSLYSNFLLSQLLSLPPRYQSIYLINNAFPIVSPPNNPRRSARLAAKQSPFEDECIKQMELIPTPTQNIPAWNANLLVPPTSILKDYYSTVDISYPLLIEKQYSDPLIYPIIHYYETQNTNLIRTLHGANESPLIVLPSALCKSVITTAHSTVHHGYPRVLRLLKRKYWWPGMAKDIYYYCRSCDACQKVKGGKKYGRHTGKMKLFSATSPFEQLSIDIVGPLPITDSVGDIRAFTIVQALEDWIATFGPPAAILSDNGSQFVSALYTHFNTLNRTELLYTSTYHPECNGQIERLHRWIKERLALIGVDNNIHFEDGTADWSLYLNIIQYSYNTTPNKMTSYAPFDIIFGFSPYRPLHVSFDSALL
eukprot:333884_1